MKQTILIVEDESGIVDAISYALGTEGFEAVHAPTAAACRERLAAGGIALVVIDVGLPDASGFDLLREIRKTSNVPALFLTARSSEIDRVLGLELGADDYVVKPFSPRELVSRVRAILRRSAPTSPVHGDVRPFAVDEGKRQIRYFGEPLVLSRYEYGILRLLISRPGWVFSRDRIMDLVWEEPEESFDRTVDAHIKSIRGKLRAVRADIDPIVTHRGYGYAAREDLCP